LVSEKQRKARAAFVKKYAGKKSKPKKQKRKPKRIFSERKQKGTPKKMSNKVLGRLYRLKSRVEKKNAR